LNSGDWSPVIISNAESIIEDLTTRLDRLSPSGWFVEEGKSSPEKRTLRSASGNRRVSIEYALVKSPLTSRVHPVSEPDARAAEWSGEIREISKTAAFALSEAFTEGLSKTRFVVWWSEVGKKLVPGLYCPDIVTALYALAMWSSGTAGGLAICQRCNEDYPRRRAKQRYCSHKCQVAAAMKRYRKNLEKTAKLKSKNRAQRKKRTGRK